MFYILFNRLLFERIFAESFSIPYFNNFDITDKNVLTSHYTFFLKRLPLFDFSLSLFLYLFRFFSATSSRLYCLTNRFSRRMSTLFKRNSGWHSGISGNDAR